MPSPDKTLASAARLEALRRLNLMDTAAEPSFDRLTRLAARALGIPVCLVSLVDDRRQFFKSAEGLGGWAGETRQTPLTHSFCQHVVTSGAPLVVDNASQHPVVCDNLAIPDLGVQAYLGLPLRSPDGWVVGSFCAIDDRPHPWSAREIELMTEFCGLVEAELALRAAAIQREGALARYQAVLDSTALSMIATTPEGVITVFNVGAERMLGYTAAEMVDRQTPAILHVAAEVEARAVELSAELGRTVQADFETFTVLARQGRADEREWTYVRKDGSRLPVLLMVSAHLDAQGRVAGFLGIARDDSERQASKAALENLANLLRQTGEVAKVGGWELDLATMKPIWTVETGRIHELEPPVAPPMDQAINFYAPEARPVIAAAVQRAIAEGTGWDLELPVITAKGRPIWVRTQGSVIQRDGVAVKLVGAFQDITERKRAEAVLRKSEEFSRRIIENSDNCLIILSLDGRLLDISLPGRRLMCVENFESIRNADWFSFWKEEGQAAAKHAVAQAAAGQTGRFQGFCPTMEGTPKWWDVMVTPLNGADGKPEQLLCISTDITEQKNAEAVLRASEARFRTLSEHAPVGIYQADAAGGCTYVNSRWSEITGITPEEAMGDGWSRAIHQEDRATVYAAWLVFARGEAEFKLEYRFLRGDGAVAWVDGQAVQLRDDAGMATGYIGTIADVTERKQLELSLANARDQALESSRLKSEFLSTMSHEIRTPMNGVLGMAGLLMTTPLSEEQRQMGEVIEQSAESLLTVINDILDFSRIEAGKMRIEPAEFDLRRVVADTAALLAPRAHQKGLELICDYPPRPPEQFVGDGGRLRQVLVNLLGNAVKFTDAGEVQITMIVRQESATEAVVRIEVRDTGVGIAPEAQRLLFQPFVQVDGSASKRFGGTGLGLAISRQLVELMGGTIGLNSVAGKGSTFWIELPMRRGGKPGPNAPTLAPTGKRVLVVDDNETNRQILMLQLARCGLVVEAVASGKAALDWLRAPGGVGCDLVILDWQMPGMNGLDLAVEIRANPVWSGLPLVMLSSAAPLRDPGVAAALGFAAMLTKPVREEQLHRCVARVLSEAVSSRPAPTEAAGPAQHGDMGLRLLLAEDNAANQLVAKMLLARMGHTVEIAENGELALARLATARFDAVLMDCQMPLLDGYEATRRIRAGLVPGLDPAIPIIALTAYARTEDRLKCLDAGMNDYVSKPLRAATLGEALRRQCPMKPVRVSDVAKEEPSDVPETIDAEAFETARSLPGEGGQSLLPELVSIYVGEEAGRLAGIARYLEERQAIPLAEAAHALGGNAASFGGGAVRHVALGLEAAARAGDWALVETRHRELLRACLSLRAELVARKVIAK